MNKQTIYISGKITGLDHAVAQNYFDTVAQSLRKAGYNVVNPMEICPFNETWTWEQYMAKDLEALLFCDAIFMLDNWKESKGADIEHYIATKTGKTIYYSNNHQLF
jgi:hypothetical protein